MSISNTTNTPIGISIATSNPTKADNIATGYPLGQEWFNTTTGDRLHHKTDGIWVSYNSTAPAIDGSDSPVVFADYATTQQLDVLYDNGITNDGIGAQLISSANGALVVDGATMSVGDTILVKNQGHIFGTFPPTSLAYQNGVYILAQQGSLSQPYILTRADYADEPDELFPSQVNVLKGPTNKDRFFLQKTEAPVLGTDDISYQINYVPPTQTIILPVIYVDTVTSAPLPDCNYEDVFPDPVGGIYSLNPIASYLTATTNGALGYINGVSMLYSSGIVSQGKKILVRNQSNSAQNGDYELIQNGGSTQPWKLKRITTSYSSFNKNVREWKVNNENCAFYGNRYYMNNHASFGFIGSTAITFSEISEVDVHSIVIATSSNITTNTTNIGGYGQHGRNTIIDNGSTPISLTCVTSSNAGFVASYTKLGTAAVTFLAGSGTTLVQVDSTGVLNGVAGSTACLTRNGNTYYLQISNR